ncbi:MAG: NAD(P)/FAD-dependent oxidoreductase, partial [Gammaproteobacteria bacterium]|nr:NAD(P)/FAD-dependent oxidoreductase [Gammaproteobacteria bacterium]
MYDIIIIGGGPAGMTATMYAINKRLNVLMISKDLGGKTNYRLELPWIQDYQVIRGLDVVKNFKYRLEYLDFAHSMQSVEKVTRHKPSYAVHTTEGEILETHSVIIATGARQQWLDVPGEKEFLSKGLCYSAMSYAPLFIDKKTVVVGEDELALRSAAELATVAEHVDVVGPSGDVLNTPIGKKLVSAKNVTILSGYQVSKVEGNGYANRLVVHGPEGDEQVLDADGAFVEKALLPNSEMVADLVDLDEQNRIIVDCFNRTSAPGIFAAGDVTNIYAEQVLVALGEGTKAVLSAY